LVVDLIFGAAAQMLRDEQWQVRHAALMAISVVAEGLRDQFAANIAEICTQVG
jgi:hypothetical protein